MAKRLKKYQHTVDKTRALTVGQVASICNCSLRCVSNWIDSGKIKGRRLPASRGKKGDRRVHAADLLVFLEAYQFEIPDWLRGKTVLTFGLQPGESVPDATPAATLIEVGTLLASGPAGAIRFAVVGDADGVSSASMVCHHLRAKHGRLVHIVLIVSEDSPPPTTSDADVVLRRPVDWSQIIRMSKGVTP